MKHINVALFVVHKGCPHTCSFCNQRSISGSTVEITAAQVHEAAATAIKSLSESEAAGGEIAFFGGSFTMVERGYMISLLEAAYEYVSKGIFKGIRLSTRPDGIDPEICEILKRYGVTAVELGAQSLSDRVLTMNERGHTAADVEAAHAMLRGYGFETGLQMMTGLYGDSDSSAIHTAEKLIALHPDTVRIYPTIVLKDTDLAALYADNIYKPQTLDKAVKLAAELYTMFEENGVRVIRLGLHSIEEKAYIAGPWHPAFSELCQSQIMLAGALKSLSDKGNYIIYVAPGCVSKMTGQKRKNLVFLAGKGYNCRVREDKSLTGLDFRTEREV